MIRHSVVTVRTVILALPAVLLLVLGVAPPAAAEPATSISYPRWPPPPGSPATPSTPCDAPRPQRMQAWVGSRYRGVGDLHRAGSNRTCDAQPNLTPPGSCHGLEELAPDPDLPGPSGALRRPAAAEEHFTVSNAATNGTADAVAAVAAARALGMLPGSAIYGDMENYNAADYQLPRRGAALPSRRGPRSCHRVGYLSGMYVNLGSGAQHLADSFNSTGYARPDALWIARYDHVASLTGWAGIPDTRWSNHQRAKQYWAERTETYGGVTDDRRQQPVGRPGRHRGVLVHGGPHPSTRRRGPGTSYPVAATYPTSTTARSSARPPGSTVRRHGGVGQADQWRLRHRLPP